MFGVGKLGSFPDHPEESTDYDFSLGLSVVKSHIT